MFNQPIVIAHRINRITELTTVPSTYGVEIDVRHDKATDSLYLSHDVGVPGTTYDNLEEYLKHFNHRFIIFNIKEAGIEDRCIDLAAKFGIPKANYFLLDVEFPYLYRATRSEGVRQIAIRFSEVEPIELALAQASFVDWVWIDTETQLPIAPATANQLLGFRTALVSPDRWGRPEDINPYRARLAELGFKLDLVMCGLEHCRLWE
ncbi:hypothetical protein JXA59_01245 [Patescibacteria group bacterium]|nr:hypothetical protein [Patescibacteria group bacterium]